MNPYLPQPYTILEFRRESPDTFTLTIDLKKRHSPGQFVQVSVPGIGEAPISICSDSRSYVKLNIREIGNVTRALAKSKKGGKIWIRGPYGKGYPMKALEGKNLVLIGGGCGVAPLKGVIDYIEHHRSKYRDIHLFLGYRSPEEILFKKELREWKKNYRLEVTIDQNQHGAFCYDAKVGFVTEAINAAVLDPHKSAAFLCGPPVMMKASIDLLKQKGFQEDQIFISAERLMYCALGVCCHCMIRGKFTCVDGPVFRYDEIGAFTHD
ncbi:MAG: FAD/NAD(P)-binding protein [Nanoarchaeota archaeon]|nr:FAD/NAD(P)-binding protein [Nanoarchaeota archaeon]